MTKRKTKPRSVEEQIRGLMPPGLSVTPASDGKILLAINPLQAVDEFRQVGGCATECGNVTILNQVMGALPQSTDLATVGVRAAGAVDMMQAFKPKDAIEGMIAAQAVALHMMTMETARRAQILGQPGEAASRLRRDTANLARAMTDMCDALDRRRGKGPQVVRVERVVVNEGGQAIVGQVGMPQVSSSPAAPMAIVQAAVASEGEGDHHVIPND